MNPMLIIISVLVGFVGAYAYEYLAGKIGKKVFGKDALIVYGYRLHHSLYGLIGGVLSFLFFLNGEVEISEILLGLSLGILVQHTLTDGFRFLSKEV